MIPFIDHLYELPTLKSEPIYADAGVLVNYIFQEYFHG